MAEDVTRAAVQQHPSWCALAGQEPAEHDPHFSAVEWVAEDFPSDTVVRAQLVGLRLREGPSAGRRGDPDRLDRPAGTEPLLALVFDEPGEQPGTYLLTFGQLRQLHEALGRLVAIGAGDRPAGPAGPPHRPGGDHSTAVAARPAGQPA